METQTPSPDRAGSSTTFSRCLELMEAWRVADRAELEFQAAVLSDCFRPSGQPTRPRQPD